MITSYESTLYIDTINGKVEADINMKYVVREEGLKSLNLYLNKKLNISKISSSFQFDLDILEKSHSQAIASTQMIKMDFKNEFKKGEIIDLFFRYQGSYLDEDVNRNGLCDDIAEMGIYSTWFPITESKTELNFKTDIIIDKEYAMLDSPNITKTDGGWTIEHNEPFYDCSFLALKGNTGL